MNEFRDQLQHARKAQRNTFIIAGTVMVATSLFVVALMGYVNGTPILIKPEDASQTAKLRVVNGIAGAFARVVYSIAGNITVRVTADGFEGKVVEITSADRGETHEVKLVEIPGKLIAKTNPPVDEVRWTIDGQQTAIASSVTHVAPAGKYKLEADSKYFDIARREVDLERGKTLEIVVDLKPVEGRLNLNSQPAGATVAVDGNDVGVTPLDLPSKGGQHRIQIRKEGYEVLANDVEITNTNPTVSRDYRLARVKAMVSFDARPKGGLLSVNGRRRAVDKPLPLDVGVPHTLRYSRSGYFPEIKTVTLKDAKAQRVQFRLKREIGNVQVRSQPAASVTVNGKNAGETPLSLKLPATAQRIVIKRVGYRGVLKTITPTHKRTTVIDVTLKTERAARLAEVQPSYQTDTGISLKLFKPRSAFQMGAPRHQKGQRANEFVRNVKLTRPFYASRHEITIAQFREFAKDHPSTGNDKTPVTSVTWLQATAFCNWLSQLERLVPFYNLASNRPTGFNANANGYRLLTEAEWEWLARKAGRSQQTIFPWGDETIVPLKSGNIADEAARGQVRFFVPNFTDGYSELAPVGSFPPESSGLFDLTGNASEWVHDAYSLNPPHSARVEFDPLGAAYGAAHVVKGSSWRSGTRTTLRAAYRDGIVDRRDDVGFRIGRYL